MGAPAQSHRRSSHPAGRGDGKLCSADRGGARQPGGTDHDAAPLEEVFRLACRYAGQAPSQATLVSEIRQSLKTNIGWQRILYYLRFLDLALLIKLVGPLELRLKKRK